MLLPWSAPTPEVPGLEPRELVGPLVRGGESVAEPPTLEAIRAHHSEMMVTLPWEGLALSEGEPAIPVQVIARPDT